MCAVGTGILDIGSRKASAGVGGPSEGLGQTAQHVPVTFGLPNVSNVSTYCPSVFLVFEYSGDSLCLVIRASPLSFTVQSFFICR